MNDKTYQRSEFLQYHIAEYTSLHGEIRELNNEARSLEQHTLYAIGAVLSWLAIYGNGVPNFAWYIPVLFSVHGSVRAYALKKAVQNISDYIVKIENEFAAKPSLEGWESHRRLKNISAGVVRSTATFWGLLIIFTIILPTMLLT